MKSMLKEDERLASGDRPINHVSIGLCKLSSIMTTYVVLSVLFVLHIIPLLLFTSIPNSAGNDYIITNLDVSYKLYISMSGLAFISLVIGFAAYTHLINVSQLATIPLPSKDEHYNYRREYIKLCRITAFETYCTAFSCYYKEIRVRMLCTILAMIGIAYFDYCLAETKLNNANIIISILENNKSEFNIDIPTFESTGERVKFVNTLLTEIRIIGDKNPASENTSFKADSKDMSDDILGMCINLKKFSTKSYCNKFSNTELRKKYSKIEILN